MRLTLRTLLAYIDGILDPEDQEDLAHRVEASEVANELVHRTRDAVGRLRLAPLPVDATGSESDANTVAEYLDNTLSPEQVAEFERRCLDGAEFPDADSYLAEVASCHHVLTMVLGERVDIDPQVRRRMQELPANIFAKTQGVSKPSDAPLGDPAIEDAVTVQASRERHPAASRITEVPDYLRASRRSVLGRVAPAIVALLLLGGIVYLAFSEGGWLNPTETANLEETNLEKPQSEEPTDRDAGQEEVSEDAISSDVSTSEDESSYAESVEESASPPLSETPVPESQGAEEPLALEDEVASSALAPSELEPLDEVLDGLPPLQGEPDEGIADASASRIEPSDALPPVPEGTPLPEIPVPDLTSSPLEPGLPVEPAREIVSGDEDSVPETLEDETSNRLGMLAIGRGVLLRWDNSASVWRRLDVRTDIEAQDRLLGLPTFRSTIALMAGLNVDLMDGTLIEMDRFSTADGMLLPEVRLVYGKLLVTNTGEDAGWLHLVVGDLAGELRLERGAAIAVNAERPFRAGVDYQLSSAPLIASCYAPVGGLTWSGELVDIALEDANPTKWSMENESARPPQPYDEEPDWINGRKLTILESEASPSVESHLMLGDPIWPQLSSLAKSRRKEERALAAICSVHVGRFDPFVAALGDADQRLAWSKEIEALRQAMARSPELAKAIRQELEAQRGEERTEDLFEMLQGYGPSQIGESPEELRLGAMRKLIDWLESDQLDYRVLANYNLEQITGRQGVFNPTGLPKSRDRAISRLRARLENGDLIPQRGL